VTNAASIGLEKSEDIELREFLDSIPVGVRRPRFENLAEAMISVNRPISIIETGCMRAPLSDDGPEGDGCSSLVWDYVAQRTQGSFITIDIDQHNVDYAQARLSERSVVVCCDSVHFLSSIVSVTQPIDFLYLDSMDWQGTVEERNLSALHHAAELAAAWKWILPGGLIAVDDCLGEYSGKHAFVKRFFDAIGIAPIVDDYIHVWRKPENFANRRAV